MKPVTPPAAARGTVSEIFRGIVHLALAGGAAGFSVYSTVRAFIPNHDPCDIGVVGRLGLAAVSAGFAALFWTFGRSGLSSAFAARRPSWKSLVPWAFVVAGFVSFWIDIPRGVHCS